MKIWQKLTLALSTTLMVFSIIIFVTAFVVNRIVGDPSQMKRWAQESDIYTAVASTVRRQFADSKGTFNQVPNPIVNNALNQTISEQKVKQIIEAGIDSTYAWLDGTTQTLQLSAGVEEFRTDFANNVADGLLAQVNSLPACTRANPPHTTDITTINCIPPGYPVQAEIDKIRVLIQSGDLSQLSQLSGQDPAIETSQGQQPLSQAIAPIKSTYQWSKRLQLIAAVIIVASTILIVALSKPRIRALRTFGFVLLPFGVVYLIACLLIPAAIRVSLNTMVTQSNNNAFAQPVQSIVSNISDLTGSLLFRFGIGMLILGIVLLIIHRLASKNIKPPLTQNPQNDSQQPVAS